MSPERVNGFGNNTTDYSEKPWYFGWSNCNPETAEEFRRHYGRPYFLPETSENNAVDWFFIGTAGLGAHMHVSLNIPKQTKKHNTNGKICNKPNIFRLIMFVCLHGKPNFRAVKNGCWLPHQSVTSNVSHLKPLLKRVTLVSILVNLIKYLF